MKKNLIFLISLFLMVSVYPEITPDSIWGVWDFKSEKYPYESLQTASADGVEYLRTTWGLLIFEKNLNGKSVIREQGYGYTIIDYHQENKDTVILNLKTELNDEISFGEVAMHFIDDNHVWFENLYNGNTDSNFPKRLRKKEDILTRMPTIESLNIPVITLNEGDLMYCNDNLRLRTKPSVYNPESKVIVSMKKGTKVKVVQKYNWPGYIDGVVSDWVEVEVIEDSFDKDGKPLPKGTRGWCFGAYLTLLDEDSK